MVQWLVKKSEYLYQACQESWCISSSWTPQLKNTFNRLSNMQYNTNKIKPASWASKCQSGCGVYMHLLFSVTSYFRHQSDVSCLVSLFRLLYLCLYLVPTFYCGLPNKLLDGGCNLKLGLLSWHCPPFSSGLVSPSSILPLYTVLFFGNCLVHKFCIFSRSWL